MIHCDPPLSHKARPKNDKLVEGAWHLDLNLQPDSNPNRE